MLDRKNIETYIKSLINKNLAKKNWIHTIFLRWNKISKVWCFDIPIIGLVDEPFVKGVPEIIENNLIKINKLKEAQDYGVTVLFSNSSVKPAEFKQGHYFKLYKMHEENGGCWYKDGNSGFEGWLCPNLFQFFATTPKQIHVCIRS